MGIGELWDRTMANTKAIREQIKRAKSWGYESDQQAEAVELLDEITQLKVALAEAYRPYKRAVRVNADVHKENKQLKTNLAKYGGHKVGCAIYLSKEDVEGWANPPTTGKCDCGWDEAKGK